MESKPKYKTLYVEGTKYKTLLTKKYENTPKWEKPDERKIISFIPGTIIKINVKQGQKVRKGQVLFILEAMKMSNKVASPLSGEVKKIHVKNGQVISKNQLIVELE